jgi:predicted membrane protein
MRLFERVQISAMLFGWANATFTYRTVLHDKVNPISFTAMLVALTMVVALLVFHITRRRSTTCKRILIVLSALAIAPWFALLQRTGFIDYAGVLSLIQGGLQIASLGLLVGPSGRAWFASRLD